MRDVIGNLYDGSLGDALCPRAHSALNSVRVRKKGSQPQTDLHITLDERPTTRLLG